MPEKKGNGDNSHVPGTPEADQTPDIGGRPPFFESPQDLQNSIDAYFKEVADSNNGLKVTITGLCLHLGFESRQSFYDYEKKPGFTYTIKKARMRIEQAYENNLHGNVGSGVAGSIFALKNMGWSDKQEHEFSGKVAVEQITGMVIKRKDKDQSQ